MIALRYVYVLALVLWLGGMITIGGVVAPAAFSVFEGGNPAAGQPEAASVVGEVLRRFHPIGWVAGTTLLVTLVIMKLIGPRPRGFGLRIAIVSGMLGASLLSGLWIDDEIASLRTSIDVPVGMLPAGDARRLRFGRLHGLSTALMGLTVAGGLALCYWETRE